MLEIVVATHNEGKLREVSAILKGLDARVLSLKDIAFEEEIIEDGADYLENAQKKSSAVARACGKIVLADDSGLEIDALEGKPGVHSARFGGGELDSQAKNHLVLDLLKNVPSEKRTARFRCIISIQLPNGEEFNCEGVCEGFITDCLRGVGGFGYDPIFFAPEYGKAMAELKPEEKNRISHRAKALDQARNFLEEIL